ncbi:MAG TPA: hypothetical protein VK826_13895, partial [Bacteroidia bacterium]|nr:hypothetical protein [Bacteroidia bacterium]
HVTGNVDLSFREFYSATDIILSGIPMGYDSAGTNYLFQSAGMFDITAKQGEEQLSIESNKSISMDFATTRNDQTYSFYQYDTVQRNWSFQEIPEVDSSEKRIALEEKLDSLSTAAPVKPVEYVSGGNPVIDLDFDLTQHPELSCYNGVIWQYAGKGTDPEANSWIYQQAWSDAILKLSDPGQGIYALNLVSAEKTFSTFVRPVLKGEDFKKAIAEFSKQTAAYEAVQAQRQAVSQTAVQTPAYTSRLNILAFGVHNLDCIRHNPEFIFANVNFQFTDPAFNADKGGVTVYVVSGTDELTIGYNALTAKNCYYKKGSGNKVIAVHHATGKACVLNSSGFSTAAAAGPMNLTLKMKPAAGEVKDVAGLESMLKGL